ncbi:MAG: hypothetical protein ACYTX0_58830 [Nostoc sp.]
MPNTSLLRLRQRLLYETLRERYFDAAQYKSVQVPHAQCPSPNAQYQIQTNNLTKTLGATFRL